METKVPEGRFYAVIVSENAESEHPNWTFINLYRNVESAMLGIDSQYHIELEYNNNVTRNGSGMRVYADGVRGHKFEFRLIGLFTPVGYNDSTTEKLYALEVDGHIPIAGDSFYPAIDVLKKNDPFWIEAMHLLSHGEAKYMDKKKLSVMTCKSETIKTYKIKEFTLK